MLSKRENKQEINKILNHFGMRQIKICERKNYISTKTASLKNFLKQIPTEDLVVYVGNRAEDLVIAFLTDWRVRYCSPSALSEEIFEEAPIAKAIL